MKHGIMTLGLAVAALAAPPALGAAVSPSVYNFRNITNNDADNAAAGEAQLSLTVSDLGGGQAGFTFNNDGHEAMRIRLVAFENDGGAMSGIDDIVNGPGVYFDEPNGNLNLPGGNSLSPQFNEAFGAQRHRAAANGVDPGEFLTLNVNLTGSYNDLINALNGGDLIGVHVQSFDNGGSEAFVTRPPTVIPTPSAVGLGGVLLGLFALRRKRSQRRA